MEQQNKNFKLVANKKTRSILPNMFTLVGVCIGLTSIKFAFDGSFGFAVLAILVGTWYYLVIPIPDVSLNNF